MISTLLSITTQKIRMRESRTFEQVHHSVLQPIAQVLGAIEVEYSLRQVHVRCWLGGIHGCIRSRRAGRDLRSLCLAVGIHHRLVKIEDRLGCGVETLQSAVISRTYRSHNQEVGGRPGRWEYYYYCCSPVHTLD